MPQKMKDFVGETVWAPTYNFEKQILEHFPKLHLKKFLIVFAFFPRQNRFRQWTLLLGYDGGRKRMYRRASFPAILRKIDGNAIRRREAKLQRQKHIYCPKLPGVPRR